MINLETSLEIIGEYKAMKIAKKLLKKNLTLEDIAEATELDINTIKELQEQNDSESEE